MSTQFIYGFAVTAFIGVTTCIVKEMHHNCKINQHISTINEIAKYSSIDFDEYLEIKNLLKEISVDHLNSLNDEVIKKGFITKENFLFNLSLDQAKLLPSDTHQKAEYLNHCEKSLSENEIKAFLKTFSLKNFEKMPKEQIKKYVSKERFQVILFYQNLMKQSNKPIKIQKNLKSKNLNELLNQANFLNPSKEDAQDLRKIFDSYDIKQFTNSDSELVQNCRALSEQKKKTIKIANKIFNSLYLNDLQEDLNQLDQLSNNSDPQIKKDLQCILDHVSTQNLSNIHDHKLSGYLKKNLISQEKYKEINRFKVAQINNLAQQIKQNSLNFKTLGTQCMQLLSKLPVSEVPSLSNDVIQLDFINIDNKDLLPYLTYNQFSSLPNSEDLLENQIYCFQNKIKIAKTKKEIQPFFQFLIKKTSLDNIFSDPINSNNKNVGYKEALNLGFNLMVTNNYFWLNLEGKPMKTTLLKTGRVGGRVLRNLTLNEIQLLSEKESLQATQQSKNKTPQKWVGDPINYSLYLLNKNFIILAQNRLNQNLLPNQNKPLAVYAIARGKFEEWKTLKNSANFKINLFCNNNIINHQVCSINPFIGFRMSLMSEKYNIILLEMSDCSKMVEDAKAISQIAKQRIQVFIWNGHGDSDTISFAPNYVDNAAQIKKNYSQIVMNTTSKTKIKTLEIALAPDAIIPLQACKVGQKKGGVHLCFGEHLATIFPGKTILAPKKSFNDKHWIITSTNPYRASCTDGDGNNKDEIIRILQY